MSHFDVDTIAGNDASDKRLVLNERHCCKEKSAGLRLKLYLVDKLFQFDEARENLRNTASEKPQRVHERVLKKQQALKSCEFGQRYQGADRDL